jgi:hypothetical protein
MPKLESELRWLLDRAAAYGVYVRTVLPEFWDQVAQWNVPCPRWRTNNVFAALRDLEQRGWIQFFLCDAEGPETPLTQPSLNHRDLIQAYKHRRQMLFYRFTYAGAAVWEEVARPNWRLTYCFDIREVASSDQREHECVVTACDEEIARQVLLVTACDHNLLVVPGTEWYSACGSWNPTYWKTLDTGVQAIASVGQDDYDFNLDFVLPLPALQRCAESSRKLSAWYERAEEPDWQFREYLEHGGMWGDQPARE